jgi:hypothetical protein
VAKTYKTCRKCFEEKLTSNFYKNKASSDGVTNKCKSCMKEYSKKYKEDNKSSTEEYSLSYRKSYYKKNRESRLLWQKDYREKNLEERRAYDRQQSKIYYNANKGSCMEKSSRRRACMIGATPPWVDEKHRQRLLSIYKTCRNVSEKTGKEHHVDHIVPLNGKNVCGLHVWWNLRIIPAKMNLSKGNKLEVLHKPEQDV